MIAAVKGYARRRLKSLGFNEWTDAFNIENIPRIKLSTSFTLTLGTAAGENSGQDFITIRTPLTVRLFIAASRNPQAAQDAAIELGDRVIWDFMKASNRLMDAGVKTVYFNSMEVEPIAESNDNAVVLKLGFTMLTVIPTR